MTYTVLIPAAGVGSRFGAPMPKQYAQIAGRPVLQHTLDMFAAHPQIARIAVIISPEDEWFDDTIRLPANATVYRVGGATRRTPWPTACTLCCNNSTYRPTPSCWCTTRRAAAFPLPR